MPLGNPTLPTSTLDTRTAESESEDAENVAPRPIEPSSGASLRQQLPLQESTKHHKASLGTDTNVQSPGVIKASKTKLKVTICNWNGVATWKWIANDDTCGICRVAFDGCCPDCKLPGDDCPVVWGACTHCFHIHCIMKWINQEQAQQLCPMCRQEWKFKE